MKKIIIILLLALAVAAAAVLTAGSPAQRHLRAARQHASRGMLPDAEAEFILATRCNDQLAEAWLGLAEVHTRMGRLDSALDEYRKAAEPETALRPAALRAMGRLLILSGQDEQAAETAEQAARLGHNAVARELNASLALERARAAVLEAQQIASTIDAPWPDASIVEMRGWAAALQDRAPIIEQLDNASQNASEALAQAALAETDHARLLRAQTYRLLGDTDAAEAAASQVSPENPAEHAAALLLRSGIAQQRNDTQAALRLVGEALAADPAGIPARFQLKRARFSAGDSIIALLDFDPTAEEAHESRAYRLGLLELLKGNQMQAIWALEETVRQAPDWLQARMTLAAALYPQDASARNPARALAELKEITAREPQMIAPHLAIAQILLDFRKQQPARGETSAARSARLANLDGCLQELRTVLTLEPDHPQALELLAEALLAPGGRSLTEGRIIDAVDALDERMRNAQKHDHGLDALLEEYQQRAARQPEFYNRFAVGAVLLARGEHDLAGRHFNAMRLEYSTEPSVYFMLARVQVAQGRLDEAIQTLASQREQMKGILEKAYAASMGYGSSNDLTEEERGKALHSSRATADFHLEAARIAMLADDPQKALTHSTAAAMNKAASDKAAMQIIAACRRIAEIAMSAVPRQLENLTPEIQRTPLERRRSELAERLGLSDAEQQELESLDHQLSLDGRYTMLLECARHATDDRAAFDNSSPVIKILASIERAVQRADENIEAADMALAELLNPALDDPRLLRTKAELCKHRAALWQPAIDAAGKLLAETRGLLEDLKKDRVELDRRSRTEESFSLADLARFKARQTQTSEMTLLVVRLEGKLTRLHSIRDRYTNLAVEFEARADAAGDDTTTEATPDDAI